ncbi:MAG: hypothetical protein JXA42_23245, partial [Anaerolineales bacterium]|nr:hypothetical protein [Anaerolineales bacterium]
LINADDGDPLAVADKAFELIAPDIVKMALPIKPDQAFNPVWNRYVGKYRNAWADIQVLRRQNQLVIIDPSLPDPLPDLIELVPVREHVFIVKSENGYANHGELVHFELDAAGRVRRIKEGENYSYPVDSW